MSAEQLYNKVKSGEVKLDQLNDKGKEALRGYMNEKKQKTVNTVNTALNTGKLVSNVAKKVVNKFGGELKTAINDAAERGRQARANQPEDPPVLKFLGNIGKKIDKTPVIGPALDWLQGADEKVSNFKAGALDTATLGATQGLGRASIKDMEQDRFSPLEKLIAPKNSHGELSKMFDERLKSPSYKAGQFGGYLAPGAMADRLVVKLGAPVLKKLPSAIQGLVRGALSGALDATAQEGGDVAFREGTFDPENIALGAGFGGALGTAVPLVGSAVKAIGNKGLKSLLGTNMRQIEALDTASLPQSIRRGAGSVEVPTSRITPQEVNPVGDVDVHWWNRIFGDQGLGITPNAGRGSGRTVTTEQQIVNNPLKNNIQGAVESTKQAARSGYQNMVDYLSPLKSISRNTYDTAMDASRANNLSNTIIRDKFVDNEGNVIGNSLNDIMKKTRGLGKKIDDYLVLRHAETRMGRGERVYDDNLNMTPEKARAAVETLEARYPGLKELGDEWDNFNGNLLDSGVREGLISEASRTAMREANPHYAAMRRQFSTSEKFARKGGGGSAFSGQSAPIKNVSPTGSTRKIVSPLRSAIEQTYAWKNAELRNRTMQEIVKAIQHSPEEMKGIAEIIKKPSTSYKNLDDALRDGGSEEFLDLLNNDFKSLFKPNAAGEENIVRAMIKGQPVYVKVHNSEAVKALLGLSNEESNWIISAFQKLSNATKRSATGLLSPTFAVKSLVGDTIQGAIQSPNAVKHVLVDVPHAVMSSIGDALHIPGIGKLSRDFRRAGGEYSALLMGDRGVRKELGSLRREAFLSPKGIAKGVVNTVKAPFKVLEKVADISENTNRMAAYKRSLMGKEKTPENVRDAINAARESTVNFSRRGAMSKATEAFIPYSNAAIQGTYRLARGLAKNPVKTLAGISTLIIAPKLYEYAKFHNDPDYQQLTARDRYRNIIYSKNADGTFNKQPIDPSYEGFGGLFMDLLKSTIDKDPDAYRGTLDSLAEAWTPPAISGLLKGVTQGGGIEKSLAGGLNSTVLAPITGSIFNQSYTGAPIVPQRLQNNSAALQADERTTSLAKLIGEKLNFAPMKVDYLMRQYGGDIARLVAPMTSDYGGGTPRNVLLKNFIVDPVFTNNLSNDFYNAKEKYAKAFNDNKDFDKPLPDWFSKSGYDLLNSQKKGSASKQLSDLSAEKRKVTGDTSLSAKEKSDKIRDIQKKINEIYIDVNSDIGNDGFKFPSR